MRQLIQDLRGGELSLLEVPAPARLPGHVLIRTSRSLISAGTERMLTEFAKAGYIEKARLQPERLRHTIEKIRTDGILATYEAVRDRLDRPVPLGYCNAGCVVAADDSDPNFSPGDRVVSNGPHAELVLVPRNLCARIPDGVSDEEASFTVVAAIALQGVRLLAPTLGETIVVVGLGLVGLLAVQILRASGCRVIGFDPSSERVALAAVYGADALETAPGRDIAADVLDRTGRAGADAVLIAAATSDEALMSQCAAMSRKRGRLVLTGVVPLNVKRQDFYEKELTFQVSCSYGPGRYDPTYEAGGIDYPLPFVRWTAQRNFDAVLELMRDRRLSTTELVTDRAAFNAAPTAYHRLQDRKTIGVVLEYPAAGTEASLHARTVIHATPRPCASGRAIAVIGAGAFAQARILPALRQCGADVKAIVNAQGFNAGVAARRFGVAAASTDIEQALADDDIGGIIIATRHESHAELVIRGLRAGKHVLVEKPLCLSESELAEIVAARHLASATHGARLLAVGFNRRFAPLGRRMREAMASRSGPAFVMYQCNAGQLPPGHWVNDPAAGGGRILGEACHFIDFIQFLCGSRIETVQTTWLRTRNSGARDSAAIALGFEDGSVGVVNYYASGNRALPKERCEVVFDGKSLLLDNFRRLAGYGIVAGGRSLRQDKGHRAQIAAFHQVVTGRREPAEFPLEFDVIENVARASLRAAGFSRES